jgi:hypothetical protein
MAEEDFPEGDAGSEAADTPTEGAGERPTVKDSVIDSTSTTDLQVKSLGGKTARSMSARKMFAEAILKAKTEPPPVNPDHEDGEDSQFGAAAELAKAKEQATDAAPAKAAEPEKPTEVAPPAPSLDPEILRLRQQAKEELAQAQAKAAEIEKTAREKPVAESLPAVGLEDYVDNSSKAFRSWLENLRGEKLSDEDFKLEAGDFITQMSADVMGVPLPDAVRTKLDAALAKRSVKTYKTLQAKKEADAAKRAEQEQAKAAERAAAEETERQWTNATTVLNRAFAGGKVDGIDVTKEYPWLHAEDEPGKIVVDVIRRASEKDGTNLSWQEASKKANDFLKTYNEKHYEKRKPLLGTAAPTQATKLPVAKPAEKQVAPTETAAPPPTQLTTKHTQRTGKWTKDGHMQDTLAAFRQALKGQGTA